MSEDRRNDLSGDERLSEAYRALSDEQTTAQMDKTILDMARAAAPKKSLARLLAIKPLAWAATAVLTVTLVVQLQHQEATDSLIYEGDIAPAMDEAMTLKREDADSVPVPGASSFSPAESARSKMQEVESVMFEQELEKDSLRDSDGAGLAAERRRALSPPQPRFCDEVRTADAQSWYQCILELEDDGRLDEAAAERTRLFSEYPDFQVR